MATAGHEKEFPMKSRAIIVLAVLALAPAAAQAGGKATTRRASPIREASHSHGASCGCQSHGVVHGVEHAVMLSDSCGSGHCDTGCDSCGGCDCDSCDPCLLSVIFDDMCNAVDSMFSCNNCRRVSCDECEVWDSCDSCDDSCSKRSPRRRPKCKSCRNCEELWEGFCCEDAGGHDGGCGGNCHGGAETMIEMHPAPPMKMHDVPAPAPAGPGKSAARRGANRSVLRTPKAVLPAPTPPATPIRRAKSPAPSAPVLNAPRVNKTVSVEKAPKELEAIPSATPIRPISALAPATSAEVELAAPVINKPLVAEAPVSATISQASTLPAPDSSRPVNPLRAAR
jgi:hypothetical protein